jgi:putative ABC transport system permease protein
MTLVRLAIRNLRRAPLRAALTALAVAVSLVAFVLLRAVSAGWTRQVAETPNDRVVARHRVGWEQTLPVNYVEQVRAMAGIKHAMGGRWAELKNPARERVYFSTTAVQARAFVDMHHELVAPKEQKEAFVKNRHGGMVSEELAREFGWKLGDTIVLKGSFFAGEWPLTIECLYVSTRHGFAHRGVWLHLEYYNERLPETEQDRINIISAQIFEPSAGAQLAKAIDIHFDTHDQQTFTQEDQALNASFVGMFGAVLQAIDVVALLILGVVILILGNTVSMGVRERAHELGLLRALGFGTSHFMTLVVGEASILGAFGGALGLLLSYPVVHSGVGRFLQETMDMPPLSVPQDAALLALLLGVLLGAVSAALPAWRAAQLGAAEALRRVG